MGTIWRACLTVWGTYHNSRHWYYGACAPGGCMRHCFAGTPPHTAAQTSGNRIKRLPEAIGKLSKLEVLNLTSNQLTQLPSSIGRLRRCVAVCVCGCVCAAVCVRLCTVRNASCTLGWIAMPLQTASQSANSSSRSPPCLSYTSLSCRTRSALCTTTWYAPHSPCVALVVVIP